MKARLVVTLLYFVCSLAQAEQYRSQIVDEGDLIGDIAPPSLESLAQDVDKQPDPLRRANTQRYLAQQFIANKQYDKAIAQYNQALGRQNTPSDLRHKINLELATVYLMANRFNDASNALNRYREKGGRDNPELDLFLARHFQQEANFAMASTHYDQALKLSQSPTVTELRTSLALNYRANKLKRCADIQRLLIDKEPDNLDHWRHLTALFIKLKDTRSALNIWLLAFEKRLPMTESDLLMLTDLMAKEHNPGRAARLLEQAIKGRHVSANARNYQRLAAYWERAGQQDKSTQATELALANNDDPELQLYLATQQMQQENWQRMNAIILDACQKPLPKKLVSRANLLLGISQLKLGDRENARRSLINATIYGGALEDAAKWLKFMQAEPPSRREQLSVSGPCKD